MHTPPFTHAGGIVFRFSRAGDGPGSGTDAPSPPSPSAARVLVVRPSRGGAVEWVLPKGHIEPGEDAPTAAVREVAEEAGVACIGPAFVGFTAYHFGGEDVACAYYLMSEAGVAPDAEDRAVDWVTLDELEASMPYPETVALVRRALELWAENR